MEAKSNAPAVYSAEDTALVASLKEKPFPKLLNDTFLRAAKGLPVTHVPVWCHRQAGRYLPEFRAMRAEHAFFEVCRSPSKACEVTVQPIDRYSTLDASIIFCDILVVPQALGFVVEMVPGKGPMFPNPLRTVEDADRIDTSVSVNDALGYVYDAIRVTRHALGGRVPLIGFCGAPWTLFAYMVDGGGSKTFEHSKTFLYRHPETAKRVLQQITDCCVEYLVGQAKAGAQALQVFESNGGELSPALFEEFALPYLAQISSRVKTRLQEEGVFSEITEALALDGSIIQDKSIPMTCFARNASFALPWLADTDYDTFSLEWSITAAQARALCAKPALPVALQQYAKKSNRAITLQGNLDPCALYAPAETLAKHTEKMVIEFGTQQYIANLGHGMMPSHPVEGLQVFTETVHAVSKKLIANSANNQ